MASRSSSPVRRLSPGRWGGSISSQWQVGKVPSGGLITAVVLKCVSGELLAASKEPPPPSSSRAPAPHPDVLTANVHFISSVLPGDFECEVTVIKSGRTTGTVEARLAQKGKLCVLALATVGDLRAAEGKGPNMSGVGPRGQAGSSTQGPPELPPIAECVRIDAGDNTPASVRERVHLLVPPAAAAMLKDCRKTRPDGSFDEELLLRRSAQVKDGVAGYEGYMFMSDGSAPQLAMAPLFLDASVPPILGVHVTGWVPSINMTVQFKRHPTPATAASEKGERNALRFRFKTNHVTGGFLEEDGEIWDAKGNLVALSRQLALVGVSQASKGSQAQSKL